MKKWYTFLALAAAIPVVTSCGAIAPFVVHAVERSNLEDALATDVHMPIADVERLAQEAAYQCGVAVTKRTESEREVLLVCEDPAHLSVEMRLRELERGFVRITVQAGSLFGDVFGGGESLRAQTNLVTQIRMHLMARTQQPPARAVSSTGSN